VLKVWSPAKYSWGNGGTFKRKGLVGDYGLPSAGIKVALLERLV
jgi:hypothetical protein